MIDFSMKKRAKISVAILCEVCYDAIHNFMSNEYDINFVCDVPAKDRKLIYTKVGEALINFAKEKELV